MKNAKIHAIHISLQRKPWRFAVHRKLHSGHDDFQLIQNSSLPKLLTNLLAILNATSPDFIERIVRIDNERLQKSPHRSVNYFDGNHVPNWRKCLPATIGTNEASAIAALACSAARVEIKSIFERLSTVLQQ